jgi:DNA-damage-inducible protein D
MEQNIILFQNKKIRTIQHQGKDFFPIVDIIEILTETSNPRRYWSDLKRKLTNEGLMIELYEKIVQLKVQSTDGKKYTTDCANTEGVLRIIMSVPSPKAEPLRQWLAQVGTERIEETENPEIGFERIRETYKLKGYSDEWIETRLKSIEVRKQLTDEWKMRGVDEQREYSILTAEIAKHTFGVSPSEHKNIKGLDKQNLRDHMTPLELIFTMLGEEMTRSIAQKEDAQGFSENHEAAQKAGSIAGRARKDAEKRGGVKIVSSENYLKQIEKSANNELPTDEK